jgi:hypothetical protein
MGQFWAVLVRVEDRRECSGKKIVSRCRERARRVYYRAVVEVKKEIPVPYSFETTILAQDQWQT